MEDKNALNRLMTGTDFFECYNNTDLFLGKPAFLHGKELPPTEISEDGKTLRWCGITACRTDGPSANGKAFSASDFSYCGLTADELTEAGRKAGKDIRFFSIWSGALLYNRRDCSFFIPFVLCPGEENMYDFGPGEKESTL